ncbi:MAG: UvrD-helicase domain-containing protein, partial [Thermoleophilaceae bacterium]|nr:UvrD-helicase domain-containing protein [Thermoleophilaceae bacterium]
AGEAAREGMSAALTVTAEASEAEAGGLWVRTTAQDYRIPEMERWKLACRDFESRVLERDFGSQYEYLRELLVIYREEYAELKRSRSALDFEDLETSTRDLLAARPDLRRRYQHRFAHVMVDEFQDTNELQLSIVRYLHLEDGVPQNRLFTVGDEFQSIYSFRHADLAVFRGVRRALEDEPEGESGVRRLSGNFRSRPEVLAFVNHVGRELFGEASYEPLTVGSVPEEAAPRGEGPVVELLNVETRGWKDENVDLELSRDEQSQPWRVAEARALARRLRELHESGFPRAEMVVLLRSFTHVEAYERALEAEGLRPYVVGGRGYWGHQPVADTRFLLRTILNPLDDLALLSVLSSPCASVRPDTLWLLRRAAGGRSIWAALTGFFGPDGPREDEQPDARDWISHVPTDDAEALRDFVAVLLGLRTEAPALSLDALIDAAITATGYDLAMLAKPGGRRRMANVRKLMRLARDFESAEGPDLRGFLEWVEQEEDLRDREGEAALHAEGHDGVRVMTVHGAKGLEFPLVAVADLGRMRAFGFPPVMRLDPVEEEDDAGAMRVGLRLARLGRKRKPIYDYHRLEEEARVLDAEEERRIFHVAATRAEQRLVVSGACRVDKLGEQPSSTASLMPWVLNALGASDASSVEVGAPQARPGLDASFAPATVGLRWFGPDDARTLVPGVLGTDVDEVDPTPIPDVELHPLEPPPAGAAVTHVSYSALSQYARCGYRFYAERVLGLRPARPGAAAALEGEESEAPDEWPSEEELDTLEHRFARGRVVHELLEASARAGWVAAEADRAAALLRREGMSGGPAEVARALELVEGFRGSALRAELASAAHLAPEAPFAFRLGGLVVRGEIDLLAELDEEVLVIDYKSDRLGATAPEAKMASYDVQRRIYALAALRRFGRAVRVAYVFLERPGEPVVERYGPEDVEAIEASLAEHTRGIEAGEFAVTAAPHRALCFDCPARERLCIHGPEETMRDAPGAPVASTP